MSSDSSDEENLEFLKEAQDNQFLNDSMFSQTPEKSAKETSSTQNNETLPSLRLSRNEDEQFNFLRVTPEFRAFVARKLSSKLDEKLEKQLVNMEFEKIPRRKRKKGGIKLLSDSETFLETSEALKVNKSGTDEVSNIKRPIYKRLQVEVSEESLKEVAVSSEDILSKKEVKAWSKRSKAPVFKYRKTKNGQLMLVESEFK